MYSKSKSGFTIIEMLAGIFILMLIGMTVILLQKDVFSLHKLISSNLTIQYQARRAMKDITSELRSASPSNLGAYPIASAATSSIVFYSDTDDDALKEKIRYFIDEGTLKKGVIKPSGEPLFYDQNQETVTDLVFDVQNSTTSVFSYFDSNYQGSSQTLPQPIDVSLVRLVRVYLVIDEDLQKAPRPLILTTQVSLRNLKDNL